MLRPPLAPVALLLATMSCTQLPRSAHDPSHADDRPPLSPADALAAFVLEPGYRIDLVAAEPLVRSPVAIAFDERGGLYVVENRGYPDPLDGEPPQEAQGVIARLIDTDGDGRYDRRTDFATGLTYPNGIMVWNGGVFVTCAPDLLYLKDTDGDGVADERRVVLTGFDATRTAQIRFSHPTSGLDNWIYLTSGLNGGRVVAPDRPDQPPVAFASSDSRVNPRTLAFELIGGQGQYGLTFDDHGRRFICSNRHPVWHVVLEPRYLRRNPHLTFSETVQEVSTVGAEAVVWPISRDLTTASFIPNLMGTPHAGTFTAASGVHMHRGDALPDGDRDSLFICESAQNLVQRQVREPMGATFRSRPARAGVEFLASTDTWFRPVFSANGPDGALYVVDMYRRDIDHPQYVPEASRPLFDFRAGKERGRIYRLAAEARPPVGLGTVLGDASTETLVAALTHPNAWRRDTAQRLLVERRAHDAVVHLRTLAASSPEEMGRLHALWTLDGLDALEDDDVSRALRDGRPGIRENAVRIAEGRLTSSPALLDAVLTLAADDDAHVRLRVALALGDIADQRAVHALAALARRDGTDRWMRAAVLSGIGTRAGAFLDAFTDSPMTAAVRAAVMADLGQVFGAAESVERCIDLIASIADPATDPTWQPAALVGLARGLRARGMAEAGRSPLLSILAADTPRARTARTRVDALMVHARTMAVSDDTPAALRVPAVEVLGHRHFGDTGEALLGLLAPSVPADVQLAAVRALGEMSEREAAARLLDARRWQSYTPRTRDAALTLLLGEARHVHVLLDALEQQQIRPTVLNVAWRDRLVRHRDPAIRARAARLLTSGPGKSGSDTNPGSAGNRMQIYERVRPDVLRRAGDPSRGAHQYTRHCQACHTVDRSGGHTGPDLSGIRNQPADAILLHIVVPDHEITPGYDAYAVETRDGRALFGRLESEAPNSVTVRDAAGQPHAILRRDIVSMTAAPSSLMPTGFEEAMSAQELADLLAYLRSSR